MIRVQCCFATSLLLLLLTIKVWPVPTDDAPNDIVYSSRGPEIILLEDVVPTRQQRQPPPPPAPLPPVIVPNDRILEDDLVFDDSFIEVEDPGLDSELAPGDPIGAAPTGARAESAPKPIRIVEPEYPRAARRKNIRAEIVITVIVDSRGRVEAPTIVERFLLKEASRQPVSELGYGLEEAALSAATRWLFRPAQKDGKAVRSQHELSFKFGV